MSKENNLGDFLLDIANAIRDREGITGKINPQDFAELIRGVPEGYTLLKYIESTGTQWIDTGFVPNQDTRVVMDAQMTSLANPWNCLFGVRNNNQNSLTYALWIDSSDRTFKVFYSNIAQTVLNKYAFPSSLDVYGRHAIDMNKNVVTIDTETVTCNYETINCPANLVLFGVSNSGVVSTSETSSYKMYSCQIYDNGNLVRDFIPCKNPSGVCGLYDKVNKVFYGSASSTPFTGA